MSLFQKKILLVGMFFGLILVQLSAQVIISGKISDSSGIYPLAAVTILTNTGKGTLSDENGNYEIDVSEKDTIWFSYLGQRTKGFAVNQIWNLHHFDISLKTSIAVLKEVKVQPRNYRFDSIDNRLTYAKAFNFKKPTFSSIVTSFGLGFTIDINELIRAFQVQKNRRSLTFKARLLQEEKDKFVNYRFNKQIVYRLTSIGENEIDSFMIISRPTFEFAVSTSDYEFREFIKKKYEDFHLNKRKRPY